MLRDDEAYERFTARDPTLDGRLYMGVVTTGIYCRPVGPARKPLRRNVQFFESAEAAKAAGLRACRRCRPDG